MKKISTIISVILMLCVLVSVVPAGAASEEGIKITCENGDILVSGSFTASENVGEAYNVYLATYEEDGTLLKVDISDDYTVAAGTNTISFTAPNIRNVQHTKAFVWTKSMNDLCDPAEKTIRTLKILGIGNSFTQDAMEWLYKIADNNGIDHIVLGYGYRGGCSLQSHWDAASGDKAVYRYYQNTNDAWSYTDNVKLSTILKDDDWNLIVLQQVSQDSGRISTFEPYLANLIDYVNEGKTNKYAQLAWQMTWAYAKDSTHSGYANYNNDQMTMYNAIAEAGEYIESLNKFDMIFPVGTVIQNARTSYIPDTNFTRDGYHLNTIFGRYIAGLTWFKTIFDYPMEDVTWVPSTTSVPADYLEIIKESIDNAHKKPFGITVSKYKSNLTEDYKEYLDRYDILEWEPMEFSFYNSSVSSTPYTPENSTSTLLPYYICTPIFTKEDIPVGSLIIVENYYQYRPEGWVDLSKVPASRPAEVSTKMIKVTSSWWGNDNYKAFNISLIGGSDKLTDRVDEALASFHILTPKEELGDSDAVIIPGSELATAESSMRYAAYSTKEIGEPTTTFGAYIMLRDVGNNGAYVVKFPIDDVDVNSNNITLSFGARASWDGNNNLIGTGTSGVIDNAKLMVYGLEYADDDWTHTIDSSTGKNTGASYATITNNVRKSSDIIADMEESMIDTVDYNSSTTVVDTTSSSTKYQGIKYEVDVTSFVRDAMKANKDTVTFMIRMSTSENIQRYFDTTTASDHNKYKPTLSWK